jgi:carbon monoxide dehydrogenase subunit G
LSSHTFKTVVKIPIETVWVFLNSMDDWQKVIPGYISHEIKNNQVSIWQVKSNFGMIKKKIHFKAEIIDWDEYERISFRLTGISDKFNGHGHIQTIKLSNHKTSIGVTFDLSAEGSLAKLIKPFMKNSIPEMSEESKYELEQAIKKIAARQ